MLQAGWHMPSFPSCLDPASNDRRLPQPPVTLPLHCTYPQMHHNVSSRLAVASITNCVTTHPRCSLQAQTQAARAWQTWIWNCLNRHTLEAVHSFPGHRQHSLKRWHFPLHNIICLRLASNDHIAKDSCSKFELQLLNLPETAASADANATDQFWPSSGV